MGLPYFVVLAVISAIGEMIPVVGPFLAAIPAILVALSLSWKMALFVAGFFLVQQQIENHLLVPKLMERQLGISPVTVIIALLVGSTFWGSSGRCWPSPPPPSCRFSSNRWSCAIRRAGTRPGPAPRNMRSTQTGARRAG